MAKLVQGFKQAFFIKKEPSFNSKQDISAADGVMLTEMTIEPNQTFSENESHLGSASAVGPGVKGKFEGTFSISGHMQVPSSGTPDQLDAGLKALLEAAFGSEKSSSATELSYESDDENPKSLTLVKAAGDGFMAIASGAVVTSLEFEITGGSVPGFTASGNFCNYSYCYGAEAASTPASGDASITLAASSEGKLSEGAKIKVGGDDNGGAGYEVTGVDGTTVAISPALQGSPADASIAASYPQPATASDILDGVSCSLEIDGAAIGFISGKVTLNTGNLLNSAEATSATATSAGKGKRELSGEVSVYFSDENAAYVGKSLSGATHEIAIQAGTEAGKKCKLTLGNARIEPVVASIPGQDVATADMSFVGYQKNSPGDELEFKIS